MRRALAAVALVLALVAGNVAHDTVTNPEPAAAHSVSLTQQRNICVFIDDNGPYWVLNRYRHLHYGVADVVQCEYIDYLFRPAYVCSQYVWNAPGAWAENYTVGTLDHCW